jgi:hypothetical protein
MQAQSITAAVQGVQKEASKMSDMLPRRSGRGRCSCCPCRSECDFEAWPLEV